MKTDTRLQQDVMAELEWEPSIRAAGIDVSVKNGVVTLTGEVGSFSEKWNAERAAQRVQGVQAIAVEIDVNLPVFGEHSDADIARSAQSVLDWTACLPRDAVKVMVEGGRLTFSGVVPWHYQKLAATDAVRHLLGVTGVSDEIAVAPTATTSAVKSGIEAALRRRAEADALTIAVQVQGAKVTLTGTVHSWAERELAVHSAWASPGVRDVFDRLTVVS